MSPVPSLALGLTLLVLGAELLVRGASRLARIFGVSPLVIGLTVVAFGTSAPELAVSIGAALAGRSELAVGNVIGSNVFNVLAILGLSALVSPLVVSRKVVQLEVPLMVALSGLVWLLAADGRLGRVEGALLFAGVIAYTVQQIRGGRGPTPDGDAAARPSVAGASWRPILAAGAGLALLVTGSHWLVDGAGALARALGVSELTIGLTVVAGGTSLPELATSLLASVRGERDLAVGNVVGSNVFNLLAVLGASSVVSREGIPISTEALRFDFPVMMAVAIACLPVFFTDHLISRWEGALFVAYYGAYTTYLVLAASLHPALPTLRNALLYFGFPLTAITLSILWARWARRTRRTTP